MCGCLRLYTNEWQFSLEWLESVMNQWTGFNLVVVMFHRLATSVRIMLQEYLPVFIPSDLRRGYTSPSLRLWPEPRCSRSTWARPRQRVRSKNTGSWEKRAMGTQEQTSASWYGTPSWCQSGKSRVPHILDRSVLYAWLLQPLQIINRDATFLGNFLKSGNLNCVSGNMSQCFL